MNRLIFTFTLCITLAATSEFQEEFKAFKAQHNKVYAHPKEESYRYQVFSRNLNKIRAHNERTEKGLESYRMGINAFTDLTFEEFSEKYLGLADNSTVRLAAPFIHKGRSIADLPETLDWREKGIVTEAKDQADCGSCWSFSATAAIEGAWAQANGKLVSLSEQNLMDCSWSSGNKGCSGGLMDNAFAYVIKNGGLDTEDSYPYTGESSKTCQYSQANLGATISSYVDVPSDEDSLKNAVAQQVVSASIHAGDDLRHYESGIFDMPFCYSWFLNHGVAVIGYGTDYWIVKNSWGSSWGENGFVRYKRGRNLCGISNRAAYPIV